MKKFNFRTHQSQIHICVREGKKGKKKLKEKDETTVATEYDSVPTFHSKILFICQLIKIFRNICNFFFSFFLTLHAVEKMNEL